MAGRNFYRYAFGHGSKAGGKNVLVIGDSFAYDNIGGEASWSEYMTSQGTLSIEAFGGAKLDQGGSPIKDSIDGWLAEYPEAEVVVLNGGTNDIKGPLSSEPDVDSLKSAAAYCVEAIIAAGRQCVIVDIPPLGDYEFIDQDLVSPSFQAEKLAAVTEYNAWLGAFAPATGCKLIQTTALFDDGAGGLDDAYDRDGLHLNVAGSRIVAGLIDDRIRSADIPQTVATVAVRERPSPELMTAAEINTVKTFVDSVASEWESAKDVWILTQSDDSAGGNALTGLKGTVATVGAGTPSVNSNGMAFAAGEYLNIPLNPLNDWADDGIGQGVVVTESGDDTSNIYCCGTALNSGFTNVSYIRWQGNTALKTLSHNVGGIWLEGELRSNNLGSCVESNAVVSGDNISHSTWLSGTESSGDAAEAAARSSENFALHAMRHNTGVTTSDTSATYSVFYLTDGTNTPATWAAASEVVAAGPFSPSVTGLSPSSGTESGGTEVTITGTGFTGATDVTFDGVSGTSRTVVSDTEITVDSPAGTAGVVDVVVTTPAGSSATSGDSEFTYTAAAAGYDPATRLLDAPAGMNVPALAIRPTTTTTASVSTASAFNAAVTSGVHITMNPGTWDEDLVLDGVNNVRVTNNAGVSMNHVVRVDDCDRILFEGFTPRAGEFGYFYLGQSDTGPVTNITIDGVTQKHVTGLSFEQGNFFEGSRITIINSDLEAYEHPAKGFSTDANPVSDVFIGNCRLIDRNGELAGSGPEEFSLRFHGIKRYAFVDNQSIQRSYSSGGWDHFRIHAQPAAAHAAATDRDTHDVWVDNNQFECDSTGRGHNWQRRAEGLPEAGHGEIYRVWYTNNDDYIGSSVSQRINVGSENADVQSPTTDVTITGNQLYQGSGGNSSPYPTQPSGRTNWTVSNPTSLAYTTPPAWDFAA
jgi:lysophospholipase L1-like esterase